MNNYYPDYLRPTQRDAIESQEHHKKCLINMWCGTGKTRTFTIDLFINNEQTNVIVFPSLGLINQYCNDYALSTEEPFKREFEKYNCLAFCSDDDGKLKSRGKIQFTTDEKKLNTFLKKKDKQLILVTYQSFEKFINICIKKNININNLIFDEAHHIVGDKIQDIVFNNAELDAIVDKTRFYTATPVNKNGITMYDRENPENSDCGELAYEYLYYQAVEDGVCKPFETQISLYTQKPEYKDKYQPVFESIIRACLSGKYNYWNILTYHSFVNENEDMNGNISFVKEFASPKNQKLVKNLFTRIQNDEFPNTKELYSVENVILKGVHSKTPNRENIIKDFDRKVEGRIYILSSCGILNEGIDTKWANMGIPINPSKSIVKESQRIGRLVRIPEPNMPSAIILIPCEVDITKYSSMDTPELRDQMIREELSECGNFNTALNVISAFKYQYDPELFEMCLKYPNMYAPKEVKDNLAKQGLIVEDSKGDLLENLKYICEKEDIEIDVESFEGENERDILNEIAEQSEKTIEIHTQNHDEPVMYVNEEASDEEPLRLFHCEDDNTYAPITKKDKKQKIRKKSTTPPKKRPKLFDVHQHPDLEVLWKIKEGSIDLNKTFSQGVLDVDINWNEKKWEENLEKVKEFMDENSRRPVRSNGGIKQEENKLGEWIKTQMKNFESKLGIMKKDKIYNTWLLFLQNSKYNQYLLIKEDYFNNLLTQLDNFLEEKQKPPSITSKNQEEKKLASFYNNSKRDYIDSKKGFRDNLDRIKNFSEFLQKYKDILLTEEEKWDKNLEKCKIYFDKYKKRPPFSNNTNYEKELISWINHQTTNYKNKVRSLSYDKIERRKKWNNFATIYKEYLLTSEEKWDIKLEDCINFIKKKGLPPSDHNKKDLHEKSLGYWIYDQKKKYRHKNLNKEQIIKWENFNKDYLEKDYKYIRLFKIWKIRYDLLIDYNVKHNGYPSQYSKDIKEEKMNKWIDTQRQNYKKKKLSQDKIDLLEKIPGWYWTKLKQKKDMSKPEIKPKKTESEIKVERQQRAQSELSKLHKEYKTKNSQNLNIYFKENPEKWEEYHKISKENEESFPEEEIPRNKIIKYLENLPGKKKKVVADLGCGFAEINQHFKDNSRFEFHNFDHHSDNELVTEKDIKNTELDDYSVDVAILSLAMWGSNCKEYLQEAHRILDTGGTLLIAEAYKRWNKELDEQGKPINRLVNLLEENNFTIIKKDEQKFMFIECRKN